MVIIYKTGTITYLIARNLVKIDNIGLVNIAAGKTIVPELVQSQATAEKIAEKAMEFLSDSERSHDTVTQLHQMTERLGGAGCGKRAAEAIMEYLK
jgi:lipid-A-disaccharide synthase